MARFTASVSSVLPSPVAPNLRTSKLPCVEVFVSPSLERDDADEMEGMAVAATPKAPTRKKFLRSESKLVIEESSFSLWSGPTLKQRDSAWLLLVLVGK